MREVRRDSRLTPDEKRMKLDSLIVERNDLLKRTVEEAKASVAKSQAPKQAVLPEGFTLIGYAKDNGQAVYEDQTGKRYTID